MSDQGAHAPRRALRPQNDAPATDAPDATDATDATDGLGHDPDLAGTPIPPPAPHPHPAPPPAPVLPPSEAAASASTGRRFSASDAPREYSEALPRRSAVSPSAWGAWSPSSPPSAVEPPVNEPPTDEPAAQPATADDADRPRRRGLLAVGVVLALAALVTAALLVGRPLGLGPLATPSPTIDTTAVYLLQPADLAGFGGEDAAWETGTTSQELNPDTPQPRCFSPSDDLGQDPVSTMVRTLARTGGTVGGVLHQVDTYKTVEDATDVYAARLAELGDCTRTVAWVMAGYSITGLADESVAVNLVVQGATPDFHTLVLSRTGTMINIVDTARSLELFGADAVVNALATVSGRQCQAAAGTCPSAPQVAPAAAPLATPPGWLAAVDLPRLTAGTGVWRGTDIPELNVTGTQCEGVALKEVAAASSEQRTYLLGDDSSVPATFGVDEVVYTFATEQEAIDFAVKVIDATAQCPSRTPTATVTRSAAIEAPSAAGAGFTVVRQTNADSEARFRTGVVRSGTKVAYLLANPSTPLDFDDAQWSAVVTRAGERLTQMP